MGAYLNPEQLHRLVQQSSPDLRDFLSKPEQKREDWVPIDWIIEALILADRIAGAGDLKLCWTIGAFVAAREAGVVQTLALKVLRPPIIMSLASGLWVTHYRNAGRVVARGLADREMIVSFIDVPSPRRAFCLSIGGWIEGFLRLGPRRNIAVSHTVCRSQGGTQCEFHLTWDE